MVFLEMMKSTEKASIFEAQMLIEEIFSFFFHICMCLRIFFISLNSDILISPNL